MTSRSRLSLRHGAGTILMVLGVLCSMLAVIFSLSALHFRLFAWLDYREKLSFAVVTGGACLVAGIIFLLAPRRRRPRLSDDTRDPALTTRANAGSLASTSSYDSVDFAGTVRPPPRNATHYTTRNADDGAIAHAALEHYHLRGPERDAIVLPDITSLSDQNQDPGLWLWNGKAPLPPSSPGPRVSSHPAPRHK